MGPGRPGRRRRGARLLAAPRGRARGGGAARARRARRRPQRRLPPARPRHLRATGTATHGAPELFGAGVYGLPELHRDAIAGADLVANPGCYPTAALLGLAPLARAGLIGDVIIDAKSGVSGAGREPTHDDALHLRRREHDPYKVGATATRPRSSRSSRPGRRPHRHLHAAPRPARAGRARLLLRHPRARLRGVRGARPLRRRVRARAVGGAAARPARRDRGARDQLLPALGPLRRADDRILVFSAIDNLWKGAASQAVQNLNVMFGRDEREGL